MRVYTSMLCLLSCALARCAVAERSAPESPSRSLLVDAFEAQLPRLPAWQRARGATSRVGPPRRSLEARADALASTQRVLNAHNVRHAAGDAPYFLAWNALSDLSDDEYRAFLRARASVDSDPFRQSRRGLHAVYERLKVNSRQKQVTINFSNETTDTTPLPKNWNWLEIEDGKYLTPIKNQGSCGSCWAFSAVSVIESRYAIENKVAATPLSVEQVLSCSAPLDHIRSKFPEMAASSKGCEGGMPFLAFEYMSRVAPNGVACASDYPYVMATSVEETQCKVVAVNQVAVAWKNGVSEYVAVEQQSEEALMRAVHQGPVSSNIDALGDGFRHYGGGIYDATDCKSDGKEVNHAVVVVGYGETNQGEKYWVVRNTWGTMWGETGYIRIARGSKNAPFGPCNLYLYSSYPVKLAKGASNDDGVCPTPTNHFTALGWAKLMGYDGAEWAMMVGMSIACIVVGMVFYALTEHALQRREAAGKLTYEDNYARWVLPTKDQITVFLARRRPQGESA